MSDEQTELLRAILAELKAQNEATVEFRDEVRSQAAGEHELRRAWYSEVRAAKSHRERIAGIFLVMSLLGMIVFAALWILWPLGR